MLTNDCFSWSVTVCSSLGQVGCHSVEAEVVECRCGFPSNLMPASCGFFFAGNRSPVGGNFRVLEFRIGDATRPSVSGPALIAHICNDQGAWGKGFVMALSARWPEPEQAYRGWAKAGVWEDEPFGLGGVQAVAIPDTDLVVVNMISQHGLTFQKGVPPLRYGALETCLHKLQKLARGRGASVHMPRIGCGLAGGEWTRIEPLILKLLADFDVFVYDFEATRVEKHEP